MPTSIALLRGINVGGNNMLPMKDLVRDLESLGLRNVRTYIQSGNVVFETARTPGASLEEKIEVAIEKRRGFRPHVLVVSADRLKGIIDANPFPKAAAEPKTLHAFFLASPPKSPDLESLHKVAVRSERFHLGEHAFYLHTPDGLGKSKLATQVERRLGVEATARNWNTVLRLWTLASGDSVP